MIAINIESLAEAYDVFHKTRDLFKYGVTLGKFFDNPMNKSFPIFNSVQLCLACGAKACPCHLLCRNCGRNWFWSD